MLRRRSRPQDIQQLTERCLGGDELAMGELVDRYRGPVYGLCYRMLCHHQDAEDAVQETFARALRYLPSWDPARSFETWLLAIAGNRCRTLLTKRRDGTPERLVTDIVDPGPDPRAADHLAEEIQVALADVRDEYRQSFLMFHQQHLSYDQIAQQLGHPVGTIKTWVHRARRELFTTLAERGVVHPEPKKTA